MVFVMNYGQSDNFFLMVFNMSILCLSLMQFRAQLTVISIEKFDDEFLQRAWANRWEMLALITIFLTSLNIERIFLSK